MGLKIIMASSEMAPYAKTGGLADVVSALPAALADFGHEVTVFLPYYLAVKNSDETSKRIFENIPVQVGHEKFFCHLREMKPAKNLRICFVEQAKLFQRDGLYGTSSGDFPDLAQRFILYSRMVTYGCKLLNLTPDIIHAHDWQAGLVPAYVKYCPQHQSLFQHTGLVFTIHNLAYQGVFDAHLFPATGLPMTTFGVDGIEYWGKISMLKAGLNFSDRITTVSKKYSREIQTPEFGCGLEGLLASHATKLSGILNGVDYGVWNSETDALIDAPFSATDLSGKRQNKAALLREFKLPAEKINQPLLAVVARLTSQKGFDLLAAVIEPLLAKECTFVLLGNGEQTYHDYFTGIARKYPENTGIRIAYDEKLAHLIEAGADMFLMPSRYEPCGLNQMYSLKYGTIPIVHATGGLDDTIIEYNRGARQGNGFKFQPYNHEKFMAAIERALKLFANPVHWPIIMRNAMGADFSWEFAAEKYVTLYRQLLAQKNPDTKR